MLKTNLIQQSKKHPISRNPTIKNIELRFTGMNAGKGQKSNNAGLKNYIRTNQLIKHR